MREFSQDEADRHNALVAKGRTLTQGLLILSGEEPLGRPGWYAKWKLRRAIQCYERALAINPNGWSSMWKLGKIHQRLGDQGAALGWFVQAHSLKPDQPDVAREASLAALDLGLISEALALSRAAVACRPEDPGLACNLALAYCLAGDDVEAVRWVTEAAERDPADTVTATAQRFISDVVAGRRERPQSLQEAFPVE
jgi:Flp pilus assembly protein TadD